MKNEQKQIPETKNQLLVGWREWVALPDLGIAALKAKVDTGARTSCLHTFEIEEYEKEGEKWVKFLIHPVQDNDIIEKECHAKVIDMRMVRDSGGHETVRYVIETTLVIGSKSWKIEMTLTARDNMRFRMLLGRTAMDGNLVVDPSASYLVPLSEG